MNVSGPDCTVVTLERALSLLDDLPQVELRQALDAFLLNGEAKNLSPRTVQYYREQVVPFCDSLEAQGVQYLLSPKAQHVRAYLLELKTHRSPGGQAAAYWAVRAFVNWAWAECDLPDTLNPLRKVPAPKVSRDPKPAVKLEDVEAMLATCQRGTLTGDRDRAVLYCLLDTGCRASEFVALNVGDVYLETGAVQIRHGKGNKARTTFVGERSRTSLRHYPSHRDATPGDPLWATVTGGPLADYVWITPNQAHDMHNGSVQDGDNWLKSFLPAILASPAWQDGGVVFIIWDEGTTTEGCSGNAAGGRVLALVIAAQGKQAGYQSSVRYSHYSLLRTVEDAWGLGVLGHAADPGTQPMAAFFSPQ